MEGAVRPPAQEPPPFPPPSVRLEPAFPGELGAELGPEVLMLWGFLHSFSDILGLSPATADEVLAAVALGERRWVTTGLLNKLGGRWVLETSDRTLLSWRLPVVYGLRLLRQNRRSLEAGREVFVKSVPSMLLWPGLSLLRSG